MLFFWIGETDNYHCNFTDQRIIVENDDHFTDHLYFYQRLIKKLGGVAPQHPPQGTPMIASFIKASLFIYFCH